MVCGSAGLLSTVLSIWHSLTISRRYQFVRRRVQGHTRIVLFAIAALFVVSLSAAREAQQNSGRARDDLQTAVQELARLNNTWMRRNA